MNVSRRFLLGAIVLSALVMVAPGSQVAVYAYVSDTATGAGTVSTVESFPYLAVSVDDCALGQNGDRVDVTVSVSNNGSISDTQTIELSVGDESSPRDSADLTVSAESTETVDLGWQPTIDTGFNRFTATVTSEDASMESVLLVIDFGRWGSGCSVVSSTASSTGMQSASVSTAERSTSVDAGTDPAGAVSDDQSSGPATNDATGSLGPPNETSDRSDSAITTGGSTDQTNSTGGGGESTNSTSEGFSPANTTGGDAASANTTDDGGSTADSTDSDGRSVNSTSSETAPDDSTDVTASLDSSAGEEVTLDNSTESGANSTDRADVATTPVTSTADGSGPAG